MTDPFFETLREDARPLRYDPKDEAIWTRLAARIRARIEQPTVMQLIVAWMRPLAASLVAATIAAVIGIAALGTDEPALGSDPMEISMAGASYDVGD